MSKTLIILNDPPYGTERSYNGLRLAGNLAKRDGEEVTVFLMGDAASCAVAGQKTPNGYYNIEKMLKVVMGQGGDIAVCGTCMDARGLSEDMLTDGARRSTMAELGDLTLAADKVLIF
ncbi:MAG: hypothetical protein HOB82_00710 [Alphaproteobacteria bacterium]|jgi:uncharacterized protein involved in oxidation of intracellular sulfur|nr:hypothetical protein [Alphaproteobacteria bacterium]MBT4710038.1 hypothetical protein [Alphaproteobacteria bacterium]